MKKNQLYVVVVSSILILVSIIYQGTTAYFTAGVTGTGNTTNNETSVTTVSLGEIYYDGDLVFTGTNTYPGYKDIQVFTIGPETQQGNGIYEIDLEGIVPDEFRSDVEITLYKTTNPTTNNITRTEGTLVKTDEGYSKEDTITINGNPEVIYQGVLSNNSQIVLEQADFTVPGIVDTTYYLVYNYINNGNQDSQQGKDFSGKVTVRYILEKTGINATSYISTLAAKGDTSLVYDGTVDNNVRYIGATPNNYITFNNELWRIIGVMNNISDGTTSASRVKLIRNESIGNYSWDSSLTAINNGAGINEWSQADLKTELNTLYYNSNSGTCYNGQNNVYTTCDFTGIGLKESQNMIDTVVWNTGANDETTYTFYNTPTTAFYTMERSNNTGKICTSGDYCNDNVTRTTTWTGEVGLMTPSDYGYATGGGTTTDRATCLSTALYNWNNTSHVSSDCYNNSWLYNSSFKQWTITPTASLSYAERVFRVDPSGHVSYDGASPADAVRPSVYLNPEVKIISGDGSENNPYTLNL